MGMHAAHLLRLLADDTRLRLLHLLSDEPLTVAELQEVTELGQSSISGHLAKLKTGGFLLDIPEGPSRRYRLRGDLPPLAARLWAEARTATREDPAVAGDRGRLEQARTRRGRSWIDRVAGSLHREYAPGRTWEALAHAAFALGRFGRCVDVGAGDGALLPLIAPRCTDLVCVEPADAMRAAGEARTRELGLTARWLAGGAERLPLPDGDRDTALLFHCLQYCERPEHAIREARRVVRPGGTICVLTLAAHDHAEAEGFGHRHRGFAPERLRGWLGAGAESLLLPAEHRPPGFQPLLAWTHA
jgi:SAM-dependent methyltransferase